MIQQKHLAWLLAPQHRWLQHLVFWIAIFFPRVLDMLGASIGELVWVYVFLIASNMFLVYVNIYFFVDEYFSRGRIQEYLIATVGTVVSLAVLNATFIHYATTETAFELAPLARIAEGALFTFSLLMTAIAFHIIKRFMVSQSLLRHTEHARLRTELNFLKSQINPHFLFNALNNIQVQLQISPKEAAQSIGHLSALLRYQLYDSAKERVNLQDEVEFLQNFLKINNMRTGQTSIDFQVRGELEGIKVSPYLFIPFVENAVKHSRGLGGVHKVRIRMIVDRQEVFFEIENSKPQLTGKKEDTGGIGLINISRRLDLLYPKRYQLEISNAYNAYLIRMRVKV
jgi:two-component system, LytTR family, sensor kinase